MTTVSLTASGSEEMVPRQCGSPAAPLVAGRSCNDRERPRSASLSSQRAVTGFASETHPFQVTATGSPSRNAWVLTH